MAFRAAVLGASGNVGSSIVRQLAANPQCSSVVLINRRQLTAFEAPADQKEHAYAKVQQHVVDMNPDTFKSDCSKLLANTDMAFVAMGVGQPSKTTKEVLEKVDVTLPTEFAAAAKQADVKVVSLLTAVGADITAKESWLGTSAGGGLYCHLKGKVEKNLTDLKFPALGCFRPATLVGSSNTPSSAAVISKAVSWMLPKRYKEIHIDHLARAMTHFAITSLAAVNEKPDSPPSVSILEGQPLFDLVKASEPKQ